MNVAGTVAIAAAVSMLPWRLRHGVRQPRTPRLAVVDIARLYESAERGARRQVLRTQRRRTPLRPQARGPVDAARRSAEQFGPEVDVS